MITRWACLFFLCVVSLTFSQTKKQYQITRQDKAPVIDGHLSDEVWQSIEVASDFVQFTPNINLPATPDRRTEVKLFYNDHAIFISAKLYDDPSKIMSQNTIRDEFGQTDYFTLVLNPNNDAQNDTQFIVFSSSTKVDALSYRV
jgi:hypothetical protein